MVFHVEHIKQTFLVYSPPYLDFFQHTSSFFLWVRFGSNAFVVHDLLLSAFIFEELCPHSDVDLCFHLNSFYSIIIINVTFVAKQQLDIAVL